MGSDGTNKEIKSPPGFKKKIFGSVLFFIGGLNLVFSVKAGISVDPFHVVVTILGSLIFLYGAVEGMRG
ncbi:MAG TPA: hypothetical protein ENK42_04540 [Deltaproteobacteria bacterium]|nr:hypothetical protein [Deltaproteobacteria bacterium]